MPEPTQKATHEASGISDHPIEEAHCGTAAVVDNENEEIKSND